MNATDKVSDFLDRLARAVAGQVKSDDLTRALYSTDASIYQVVPHGVLVPRDVDDVVAAVTLAAEYGVPLLPRAAGTSLAGQAVNEALVIDFTRHLDRIISIDPEARVARVQPGVILDDLNRALRPHGLQFGPDPASSNRACMGGIVANNSTGSHSIRYGMTADHVLGLTAVLADGSVARWGEGEGPTSGAMQRRIEQALAALLADERRQQAIRAGTPHHWRRCGGYNLDRFLPDFESPVLATGLAPRVAPGPATLLCGSEGTLGVMTEIALNLVPRPPSAGLVLLHFDDLHTSLRAVPALLETGASAIELLDDLSLRLCVDVPEYGRLLSSVFGVAPFCILIVEYDGDSEREVMAGVERLKRLLARDRLGSSGLTMALKEEQQAAVWVIRKVGLGLLMSVKGDAKPVPFIEDAAVPVEALPDYIERLDAACASLDTPITYYAHASAGCLHVRPLMDLSRVDEVSKMERIAAASAELAREYGGAISSEHGDGRTRSWLNEAFFGRELYGLYREVKRLFDPDNLFNPGMIVDARPMTDHLRRQPVPPARTLVDFSDYAVDSAVDLGTAAPRAGHSPSGYVRAVEMCNGAAVCLQRASGTMCPSFMVTRNEEDSTRGRANALRAAMTGLLPAEELAGDRLRAVMDLCVGCKACKAECPSAVDMARLKFEFLARYHAAHGVGARDRFFGRVAALNRLGSGPLASLSNAIVRGPLGRAAVRRLGVAPQRALPPLSREPFMAWWDRRAPARAQAEARPAVVLLIDPFTNYNYPSVGQAAAGFLEAAGWSVLPVAVDEGRPAISKGLLDEARKAADRTLAALHPLARQGLPIVGLEPSSLLTLRDEYFYLLPGDGRVREVAELALTFEEFVARAADRDGLSVRFSDGPRRLLLHGHCHQKALVGTGPARRALGLLPGAVVEEVDSGCCGMAGSFGYEAEHYDISMQMAERRLLPAVRGAAEDTIIVAAGVSCRQQIAHGSSRQALHPAQVLFAALAG
jgi:FAD/FMN-containing dehydrogenase/Fe-S oxidoreductase